MPDGKGGFYPFFAGGAEKISRGQFPAAIRTIFHYAMCNTLNCINDFM